MLAQIFANLFRLTFSSFIQVEKTIFTGEGRGGSGDSVLGKFRAEDSGPSRKSRLHAFDQTAIHQALGVAGRLTVDDTKGILNLFQR